MFDPGAPVVAHIRFPTFSDSSVVYFMGQVCAVLTLTPHGHLLGASGSTPCPPWTRAIDDKNATTEVDCAWKADIRYAASELPACELTALPDKTGPILCTRPPAVFVE